MGKKESAFVDLNEIRKSLDQVQVNYPEINAKLATRREEFTDTVKENMLSAYSYLNQIIAEKIDLFSDQGLSYLLELNHIVLCGTDLKKRIEFHKYIVETRSRFYKNIKPIRQWYDNHKDSSTLKRAAEIYVGVISSPQLYYEGNHRTGSIITSWILLRGAEAPFVLNVKNARAYFEPSSLIKFTDKRKIDGKLKLPKYKKSFKKFLEEYSDPRYMTNIFHEENTPSVFIDTAGGDQDVPELIANRKE